jgi:Ser/Thr protein kinase RdoA (MazF antagonist)
METYLNDLSMLVGEPVIASEPARWGFNNRTEIVTLANGTQLVLQRIMNQARASEQIRLARQLPPRFAGIGLRLPRLLRADAKALPPYAIREYLPGIPGAALLGDLQGVAQMATKMGELLPQMTLVSLTRMTVDSRWARVFRLEQQVMTWMKQLQPLLTAQTSQRLKATLRLIPRLFEALPVFCHGDFCPVNVLFDEQSQTEIIGLLDVEYARVAPALFDAAWWGWVLRFHHPEAWQIGWPLFCRAAQIHLTDTTNDQITVLQRLRCLELLAESHFLQRGVDAWIERLEITLGWETAL